MSTIIFAIINFAIYSIFFVDDDTRVMLKDSDNGNDYVNASYIKVI